jgi:ElaB/YqjD/DUF883 family membrane-anchored ribosome-binding protein
MEEKTMAERGEGMTGTSGEEIVASTHQAAGMLQAGRDQAIEEAKAMLHDVAETQRRKALETLGGVAQALHRTAKDLDAENKTMARYTDIAAERLDDAAKYLRQAQWTDLVEGAESFARRQPWWFVGGAVATGFIVARMVKASGSERHVARAMPGTTDMGAAIPSSPIAMQAAGESI